METLLLPPELQFLMDLALLVVVPMHQTNG
jgi:hypothetical protein